MENNLRTKAASSVVWTAVQKYATTAVSFIAGIILARLLTPYDYGCVGMLAIFITISETFVDAGFGTALIQKKTPTQTDYSTVFFWNLGMSVVVYAILYFISPWVSSFYGIDELCAILRAQGTIIIINAFSIIQINQLKKNLNFKPWSIITLISQIVALIIAIIMAYYGFGAWSLVARNLVAAFLTSLILWIYMRWRPLLVFSWNSFKQLFVFGFYIFLSHLVTRFSVSLQGLLIGKVYNANTLGYYTKADGFAQLSSRSVSNVLDQVTYPLYAEVQDNKVALQNMVRRFAMTVSYIMFPLLFLLILVAEPLFVILYGDKWLPCVPYFQILCLAGLGQCLQSTNFQTIAAIGKSKVTFLWTFVKRGFTLALMVGGLYLWGLKGLLLGAVLNDWIAYFINILLVSKYIGYKWWRQLFDIFPVLIVVVIAFFISYGISGFLNLNLYCDGMLKIAIFLLLFLGWSFGFKPESYTYTKGILLPYFSHILIRKNHGEA